ncbi:MAG TPA: M28 family metallopeptidase [Symbiobacteriaceae bacterium]|nr:M28 family metallopeptidase [Symbiobacteriaceae bacterium]
MLRPLVNLLAGELSGRNCMDNVEAIVRHHRIQASPGYRAAAQECLQRLQQSDLEAFITTYPATGRHWQWTNLTPQEWDCQDAELWLLGPDGQRSERLAWYREMNLSIIQRSCATPAEGVTAELAFVDDAEQAASWAGRDLAGKLVLVGNGDIHRMLQHARKAGAAGLATARMTYQPPVRPVGDLADVLQYTSFWWSPGEEKGWGFVLSTGQGERLKRLLADGAVKVWAKVEARFYDGTIENVEAVIPGTTDEEVLVVSHLCHPKPSANDNATGPATVMETARVLQKLIAEGRLAQPRRTIRFVFPPEMTGTYAHLAARPRHQDIERIRAALNVDMVGQKQEVTGSVLLCEYPPMACPSFTGDLLALVLAEVAAESAPLSGSGRKYGLFRHAVTAFSGGSDHYILSDPTVGVPCPMIIQWPDRFYHTSADTADKCDPAMMRRVGLMVGAYAYFAANAGPDEARWLAGEMAALFPAQLHESLRDAADPEAAAGFRLDRKLADIKSLRRLAPPDKAFDAAVELSCRQVKITAEMELQRAVQSAPAAATVTPADPVQGWTRAADLTDVHPVRRMPGPVSLRHLLSRLTEAESESWRAFSAAHHVGHHLGDHLLYWTNGDRSLAEICRLTALETGEENLTWSLGYFQLLARLDLVAGVGV